MSLPEGQGQKKESEKEHTPASKIPAGLETLYALERDRVKSSLGVLILAVHWSIVRAGLRIPTEATDNGSSSSTSSASNKRFTERLPRGWSEEIPNSPTPVFTFDYGDPLNPDVKYQVKVIEIVPDYTAVVTVYRQGAASSSSPPNLVAVSSSKQQSPTDSSMKTSASTFQLPKFIQFDKSSTVADQVAAESVFYKATELENQIWSELMEPLGLKVIGLPPFQGPYEDKVKSDNSRESEQQRQLSYHDDSLRDERYFPRSGPPAYGPAIPRPGVPPVGPAGGFGPLFVPPVGGGGLGRSDLDPLGGDGAGMIADPRGFRTPRLGPGRLPPGAAPPGARFDPFGPPLPTNPNVPGTGPNWAVPNPDEPPPPGFDDMFM